MLPPPLRKPPVEAAEMVPALVPHIIPEAYPVPQMALLVVVGYAADVVREDPNACGRLVPIGRAVDVESHVWCSTTEMRDLWVLVAVLVNPILGDSSFVVLSISTPKFNEKCPFPESFVSQPPLPQLVSFSGAEIYARHWTH